MGKTYYVDTNVFLRFILGDNDKLSEKSLLLFKKAQSGKVKLICPTIVIPEIVYVLEKVYSIPKPEVVEVLKNIITTPYITVEDKSVWQETLNIFISARIDLVDAFLISKSISADCRIITFDKKLEAIFSKYSSLTK